MQYSGRKLFRYPQSVYFENQKQKLSIFTIIFELHQIATKTSSYILLNYLILDRASFVSLITDLFISDLADISRTCLILWSTLRYEKLVNDKPSCYYFSSIKNDSTSFFTSCDVNQSLALVGSHTVGINSILSHKSNIINGFRIIVIKIIIIQINIIKIYTIKAFIIAKECNTSKPVLPKTISSLQNEAENASFQ